MGEREESERDRKRETEKDKVDLQSCGSGNGGRCHLQGVRGCVDDGYGSVTLWLTMGTFLPNNPLRGTHR